MPLSKLFFLKNILACLVIVNFERTIIEVLDFVKKLNVVECLEGVRKSVVNKFRLQSYIEFDYSLNIVEKYFMYQDQLLSSFEVDSPPPPLPLLI
jgi:hypothetical protein